MRRFYITAQTTESSQAGVFKGHCPFKAVRNDFKLMYKTHYNDESFEVLDFLKVSAMKKNGTGMPNPIPLDKPAGFSDDKKQNILENLTAVIP